MKLDLAIQKLGAVTTVTLKGNVDEHAEAVFKQAAPKLAGAGPITVDCGGLVRINSRGIAHWSTFLAALTEHAEVRLERCTVELVEYGSVVPSVFFDAEVASFYVPLRCAACASETAALATQQDVAGGDLTLARFRCAACGGTLVGARDLAHYCDFLDPDAD